MQQPLCELLRPTKLGDLVQSPNIVEALDVMVRRQLPQNMILYGSPGMGKTSAARLLKASFGLNCFEINGSLETGVSAIRQLEAAANSLCLFEGPRVCFIEEAEFLSLNAQAGLRALIERSYKTCRFILTANDIRKFHPALKSRCMPLCFDIYPAIIAGRYDISCLAIWNAFDEIISKWLQTALSSSCIFISPTCALSPIG